MGPGPEMGFFFGFLGFSGFYLSVSMLTVSLLSHLFMQGLCVLVLVFRTIISNLIMVYLSCFFLGCLVLVVFYFSGSMLIVSVLSLLNYSFYFNYVLP